MITWMRRVDEVWGWRRMEEAGRKMIGEWKWKGEGEGACRYHSNNVGGRPPGAVSLRSP
jgi:hypothetical protein